MIHLPHFLPACVPRREQHKKMYVLLLWLYLSEFGDKILVTILWYNNRQAMMYQSYGYKEIVVIVVLTDVELRDVHGVHGGQGMS